MNMTQEWKRKKSCISLKVNWVKKKKKIQPGHPDGSCKTGGGAEDITWHLICYILSRLDILFWDIVLFRVSRSSRSPWDVRAFILTWGLSLYCFFNLTGFPGGSVVKNPLAMQETQVQSLGQEERLEKGMATHSSILAWRIPGQRMLGGYSLRGL